MTVPTTQISINDIISIRVALGSEDQVESPKIIEAIDRLDTIILAFAKDLNINLPKGN